jgi:oligosaccharide repeat unit polymerase
VDRSGTILSKPPRIVWVIQGALVALSIVALLTGFDLDVGPESVALALCFLIFANLAWSLFSWSAVTGSCFDCYTIFLVAANLFNAGCAFLELFGCNPEDFLGDHISPYITMQTLFLVLASLVALHTGALWGIQGIGRRGERTTRPTADELSSLRAVGLVMLVGSIPFAAMKVVEELQIVMSEGYFALYQHEVATGFATGYRVLATFLAPGVFFLFAGSRGRRTRLFAAGVLAVYCASQLFLGVRHEAAILIMVLVWLWDRLGGRLNRSLLIAGAAAMLVVVFPLVAATRDSSGQDRTGLNYLADNYATIQNPLVSTISEMGGTMRTVAYTIELVPSTRGFDYGDSYAYASLTVFPNLFWKIHPTIAHELPSSWITWAVDPGTARQGGGLGYSFIAEAYLNFGYVGAPLVMFLGGYFAARFMAWACRGQRPDRLAFLACAATSAIFLARAESAVVFRELVWNSVLPFLAVSMLDARQRAKSRHGAFTNGAQSVLVHLRRRCP